MRKTALTDDLLNANKIRFHFGKIMEDAWKGQDEFPPVAIEIHPTAMCNHRCIHCSYKERNESRASLSKEVMDRLIDSVIHMKIRAVYFSGGGEPTLYPGLKDYIEKLYANGVEGSIITNASCFADMGLIEVADRLNYIAVSVPGIEMDSFQTITGTRNLEAVLALPGQIRKVHGDKSPVLGSRIVLTNKNYKYLDEFLTIIKEKQFDYALFKIVRDYEDSGQGLNEEEEEFLRNKIGKYENLDYNFTNLKSIFEYRKMPEFKGKCWVNQYGMIANVSTDGKVYPNIVEIDKEEFCIGDLNKESLEEIWNSQRHKEVKEASNRKWMEGACKNCRAISYNRIINETIDQMPAYFDPFI